jgi:hypothetical protein
MKTIVLLTLLAASCGTNDQEPVTVAPRSPPPPPSGGWHEAPPPEPDAGACSITPPPELLNSIADAYLSRPDGGCEWTLIFVDGGVLTVRTP